MSLLYFSVHQMITVLYNCIVLNMNALSTYLFCTYVAYTN